MVLDPGTQSDGRMSGLQPAVDVRLVLFSLGQGELWVALAHSDEGWELPSVSLNIGESLDGAAMRALRDRLGAELRYIEQLYSLAIENGDAPAVLIAYLGIAEGRESDLPNSRAAWISVAKLPHVSAIDAKIIEYAIVRLRAKLGYTTVAFHLLPKTFSLSELQQVYEIVLGRALDKRNFRRRIQSAEILESTAETRREGSHRPAQLYQFRAVHDADAYLTPVWASGPDGESTQS